MAVKNEHGLTPAQEIFAQHLAKGDQTQSECYRIAYPKARKWKTETVNQEASRIAALPHIRARVTVLAAESAKRVELDRDEIFRQLRAITESSIVNITHPDGRVKLPHELDAKTAAAVSSFRIDADGRIEYKFWDKNTALTNSAKIVGAFELDNKQKVDPLAQVLSKLGGNVVGVVASVAPGESEDDED